MNCGYGGPNLNPLLLSGNQVPVTSNGAGARFFLRLAGASAPSAPPPRVGTERDSIRWINWSTVGAGAAAAGAAAFWPVARGEPARMETTETTSAHLFIDPPGGSRVLYCR